MADEPVGLSALVPSPVALARANQTSACAAAGVNATTHVISRIPRGRNGLSMRRDPSSAGLDTADLTLRRGGGHRVGLGLDEAGEGADVEAFAVGAGGAGLEQEGEEVGGFLVVEPRGEVVGHEGAA